MARKRKKKRTVSLPWEQERGWRRVFSSTRSRLFSVAVLLGVLGVLGYRAIKAQERKRQTRVAIAEVRRAIHAFRAEVGRCPRSMVELVHPPRAGTRYLRTMPRDGWGEELWVRCPAVDDPELEEVLSAGPSGSFFHDDNIQ